MGITDLFKEKSGAPFIETEPGGITAADDNKRGAPVGDKSATEQNNVVDEANFEDVHGNRVLTEAEARKLAAALAAAKNDEEFQAALSGILAGRIFENYFDKNQINQKTAREKDQKARADMYYIAILQAQLDDLNQKIAAANKTIVDIEERYLTQAERDQIAENPKDQQYTVTDAIFRDKVVKGEMPQSAYDNWKKANQDLERFEKDKARISEELEAAAPEDVATIVHKAAKRGRLAAVEAAADKMSGAKKTMVDAASGRNDFSGNAARRESDADEAFIFGSAPDEEKTPGKTSFASGLPDKAGLEDKSPPLNPHFAEAAAKTEAEEPPMKTAFDPAQNVSAPGNPNINTAG